jgi:hypothetical protein
VVGPRRLARLPAHGPPGWRPPLDARRLTRHMPRSPHPARPRSRHAAAPSLLDRAPRAPHPARHHRRAATCRRGGTRLVARRRDPGGVGPSRAAEPARRDGAPPAVEPGCHRLGQRVLLGNRAGRVAGLAGAPFRIVRLPERDHRRQDTGPLW